LLHLLSGPVDSGKTSLLFRLLSNLGELRPRVDGFLTPKVYEGDQFIGYDLLDLKAGELSPFIRVTHSAEKASVGRFYFLPEGLEKAVRLILQHQLLDYLIVDEVGPLELGGRGLWPALSQQLRRSSFRGLIVIRMGLVEAFSGLLQGIQVQRFDINEASVEADLEKAIRKLYQATPLPEA